MKKTKITIEVELDENHIPEKMIWNAPDGGVKNEETKAIFLSVWDENHKQALRLDLWTKDMQVDLMKRFFHQTLLSMADTYERATMEDDVAQWLRANAEDFAVKSGIKS